MFLKHLAMHFLEEFFLMVFLYTTISVVSEKLADVLTLSKGLQPHLTKRLCHNYLSGI